MPGLHKGRRDLPVREKACFSISADSAGGKPSSSAKMPKQVALCWFRHARQQRAGRAALRDHRQHLRRSPAAARAQGLPGRCGWFGKRSRIGGVAETPQRGRTPGLDAATVRQAPRRHRWCGTGTRGIDQQDGQARRGFDGTAIFSPAFHEAVARTACRTGMSNPSVCRAISQSAVSSFPRSLVAPQTAQRRRRIGGPPPVPDATGRFLVSRSALRHSAFGVAGAPRSTRLSPSLSNPLAKGLRMFSDSSGAGSIWSASPICVNTARLCSG